MDGLLHQWKPMLLGSFPPCFFVKLVASARTSDNKLLCGKGISGCSSHFIPLKSGAFAGFRSGPPVEWAASEHPVVWQRTSPWGWPHLHRWTCSERCIWALRCATRLQSRAIPWAQRSGEITGGNQVGHAWCMWYWWRKQGNGYFDDLWQLTPQDQNSKITLKRTFLSEHVHSFGMFWVRPFLVPSCSFSSNGITTVTERYIISFLMSFHQCHWWCQNLTFDYQKRWCPRSKVLKFSI